jgi:hypothetical protein
MAMGSDMSYEEEQALVWVDQQAASIKELRAENARLTAELTTAKAEIARLNNAISESLLWKR